MFGWLFGSKKRRRHSRHPPCEECSGRSTVVRCVPHNIALCVSCMFSHDDPNVCSYIPDSDKRKHWRHRYAAATWILRPENPSRLLIKIYPLPIVLHLDLRDWMNFPHRGPLCADYTDMLRVEHQPTTNSHLRLGVDQWG